MLATVVQIDGWDPVAAAAVVLRASSHDDPAVCHLNGQTWWPMVAKLPTLRYDLFDGAFAGQITAPSSTLTLQNEAWPDFGQYMLADARFQLWTGQLGADWGGYTLRFDGRVSGQPQLGDGKADIGFAVDDRWLDAALLATYAGTTGAEGPIELKGQVKPLALGAPRYVAGTLIDSINSVFQVSAYGPIQGFIAALEKLARFGPAVADYSNYAALVAATIPPGMWATARAVGLARFGAPPAGQISFLLRGDAAGLDGWVRKPGQLIRRIAQLSGGAGRIDDASLDALDVARPYNLSVDLDQQTTARDMIQKLAASVNAVAGVSWTGQLFVVPVAIGAPTVTLAVDGSALPPVGSVKQIEIDAPYRKLAIGAERAWTVHALGDIAFEATLIDRGRYDPAETYRDGNIVDLADGSRWLFTGAAPVSGVAPGTDAAWKGLSGPVEATYADGTPVDDLKPAQPDATAGGTIGVDVRNPDGSIFNPQTAFNPAEIQAIIDRAMRDIATNTDTIAKTFLTLQGYQELLDARTLLEGQPLSTKIVEERTNRTTATNAIVTDMKLLGAKSADGALWLLNMEGLSTGDGGSLGSVLTQLGSATGEHQQQIDLLLQNVVTDTEAYSKALLRVNQDGVVAGLSLTSNGVTGRIAFLANEFTITDPSQAGRTFVPFTYSNGLVRMSNVEIDKLAYGALIPLFAGAYNNLDPNGSFQILPGGFIFQTGKYRQPISSEQQFNIEFPMPFPNAVIAVLAIGFISGPNNLKDLWIQNCGDPTLTHASFYSQAARSDAQSLDGFDWFAFGK